jgi:phosphotransacetylase
MDEVKYLADTGTQEIILLGQNVNAYSNEKYKLSNLILEIEKCPEIKRIRYTTSHPKDMSDDLIEVYKYSNKLMPLVHLPVQSGSNKVLDLMNRKHTISEYYKIYDQLKKINSDIQFSSDFIIGYPGEDEEDFNDTFELIQKIKFINSYSFIFSPRPGTVAADLKLIDKKISMERLEKIQSQLYDRVIWATSMVACGDADGAVTGNTRRFGASLDKIKQVVSVRAGEIMFGLNMVVHKGKTIFVGDTSVHEYPTSEQMVEIAISAARVVRLFGFEPKVAFVSHSTFGQPLTSRTKHIRRAVEILKEKKVDFEFDGDMQPDVALDSEYEELYPFSKIVGKANILIMPGQHSAAISYKMMKT